MSTTAVALTNESSSLQGLTTSISTAGTTTRTMMSSSANSNSKISTICRVVAIDDEDSRECPSQGVSEIARDDIYNLGVDERFHRGGVCPAQQTTKHILYTMYNSSASSSNSRPFSQRVAGLRRHSCDNAFLERRDCNSFDTHDSDSDSEDECVSYHRNNFLGKHHQQQTTTTINGEQHQLAMSAALVEAARRNSLAGSTITGLAGDDSKNKRKTPSPVMGIEPAPVSIEPLYDSNADDEDMDVEDAEESDVKEFADTSTSGGYESPVKTANGHETSDDTMLPCPAKRVSLSPVSRRLALQFDTISFYSPVRPSTKRRKTLDTSATCL